ncbi:MAG: class I SAM-dependent methyltransferase [Ignavibacteriae bacterium]|nr:class I SAM-dependent methyltransferase [Ignavibacteriota bacterium]
MDQMNEFSMEKVTSFYDSLAQDYDSMIDFEKRFIWEKPVFNVLVSKYNIRSAVDAGCGTGFHSLLLAWLGVRVTAIDGSTNMVFRLKEHALEMNLNIEPVVSDFQHLSDTVQQKVDAVFCLGNTLPHLLSDAELNQALTNFKSVLNEQGVVILQLLNYKQIMKKKERIQNVKERDGKIYVRFYDYLDDAIAFNMLTLGQKENQMVHELQTTMLNPVTLSRLQHHLSNAGFTQIELFGSLSFEPFDDEASHDLVIVAS